MRLAWPEGTWPHLEAHPTTLPDGAPGWDVVYYAPDRGRLDLVTAYLGPNWVDAAVRLAGGGVSSYATSHQRGGLYRRTIGGVRLLLEETGFEIEDTSTRFTTLNTARLPWLGEALTWYVQFLVHKPARME